MTAISSCTPEENDDVKPSMTFSSDGAGIIGDVTKLAGEALLFKVSSIENPTTKKNLKTLRVQSFTNNTPNIDTTVNINGTSSLNSFNYNAPASGEEKFTFTLTDAAGETAVKIINVTVVAPAGPITSITNVILLGAQSNLTDGSFLDAHTGDVYKQTQAISNSAAIDMIYFYGTNTTLNNNATLAAPNDATVNGTSGNLSMAVGMNPQNATKFTTTSITTAEFDAMTDDSSFPATVTADSKANNLAANDVIAFQTADGKVGLIKVKTITGAAAGSMTIDLKIQE